MENPPAYVKEILAGDGLLRQIMVKRVLAALDVDTLNGGIYFFHRDEGLSSEALDLAAEIQESIQDFGDIFLEGEHQGRWEECKRIAERLERLDEAGAALVAGNEDVIIKGAKPMPTKLLVCAYVPNTKIPKILVCDKRDLPPALEWKPLPKPATVE